MQTEMKCPTCGGDKYKFLGGNTFKCAYCGATFVNEQQTPEVQKEVVYVQSSQQPYQQPTSQQSNVDSKGKSKDTAIVLCFFLGIFGVHKFYLGKSGQGFLYLLLCWTFITTALSLVDFIVLLCMNNDEFNQKYNY